MLQLILATALLPVIVGDDVNRHLFPSKSNMVMTIDLGAVRDSGLFNDELTKGFTALIAENEQVKKLSQILNFDPAKEVSSFTICGVGEGRQGQGLMIVNGNFPYEKLGKELATMADTGELTSMTINDLPVYFNHKAREAVYFAVVDQATAIASTSKRMLEDAIQGLTELREPDEQIKSRLAWGADEGRLAMSIAGVFPKEAKEQMAKVPQLAPFAKNLVAYNIAFRFGEPNHFQARLTMTDAQSAKATATTFKTFMSFGMTMLRAQGERMDIVEMMEKIKIGDKDKDLTIEAEIPKSLMGTIVGNNRKDQDKFEKRRQERRAAFEKARAAKKKDGG